MEQSISQILANLIETYRQKYFQTHGQYPQAQYENDWISPCLPNLSDGQSGAWLPVKRENAAFEQIEAALCATLSTKAQEYWNSFFSGNIFITTEHGIIELLQAWNENDYLRFQQNLVGHLLTQKRFKLPYTVFIGVQVDGEKVLTVDENNAVWLEIAGQKKRQLISEDLAEFLTNTKVVVE